MARKRNRVRYMSALDRTVGTHIDESATSRSENRTPAARVPS
jgi:hypothetical protein